MATKQDNRLDPGQQEYERNFDFERHERELQHTSSNAADNPAEQASMDRAGAWSRDSRSVAERESAPSWDTNVGNNGGGGQRRGGGRFNIRQMLKKRVNQWIIGGLVTLILTTAAAVPAALSGALVHMKELASDWANKNNHSYFSKRTQKYMKKKLFQADKDCKGGVKCRFKTGVSDEEIDKMKKAGLNPEVGQDGDKKFIKSLSTTDVEGKTVKISADNFEEHYGTNVKFRAQMDEIAKPKSMLLRGKQTLKLVFDKFGIKRNRTIDGADEKERTKNFRADEYGDGNETEKANSAPDGGDEDKNGEGKKIAGVDDSINEAAQQERERLTSSGFDRPPSIIPDTSNLDLTPDKAADVANGLVKGGLKGAVLGVFAAIDKACSGYQLIRAVVFGAKIYKVLALVKYAGIFMTIADKLKSGDATVATEIGFIAAILFKPSNKKDSFGKTFFQSEGFNLIFQGKIADHRGLARYTTGSSFLKFLQGAKKVFEDVGANKSTCKQVKSWYGQAALVVAGLTLDIFSGGGLSVGGVVAGAAIGMVVSVLTAYVTPLLIQYAAGTVAPDVTDPEGGYGAGNAIAAGIGAFGHFTGSANGERILTTSDAAQVEMESNKEMAFETKVDNYGKSPFSLDSGTSIPSQLAMALAPVMASPVSQGTLQSVASIITSPFSLFSSSFSNIVTGGVNAQSDIARGGQFCADEDYAETGIAVDAFCNPIPGEKDSTINDPKYEPEAVDKWMFDNGHADPDSGEPKSDDFKKYIASCVDSTVPISPDGGGVDVGEDVDTRWCYSTEEKFNYFRFFIANNAIDSAHEDSVKGTLGQEESAGAQNNPDNTVKNGELKDADLCALGPQWPGQKLQCGADDKFAALNAAFKKQFNKDLVVVSSYRSLDDQKACKAGPNADDCATPGTSNHGCGLAIDLAGGIEKFGTPEYNWMLNNAPPTGWVAPAWAQQNGSNPQPWHWEYGTGGQPNSGTCQL
jgi:hypothetical protein